jgi:putative transposase
MARQPRVEHAGALHHVMSRGNDGILIFRDDKDRERFLALLAEEIVRSAWTLHDYCLMSNHYHLSISTPECTLSTGMHRLLTRYVQYFNRRHGRRGHLFQERFKNVLIEEETHGIVVSRYLALNPVRAGICERPENWRWSSYAARAGLAASPAWLTLEPLASQFGADVDAQRRAFREFVLSAIGTDNEETPFAGFLMGSRGWIDAVQVLLDQRDQSEDHPRAQVHPGRPNLESVIAAVAQTFDATPRTVVAGRGSLERRLIAFLAFEDGLVPLRQIARVLHLRSAGHVSDLVRRCRAELEDRTIRDLTEACRGRMQRREPAFLLARDFDVRFARHYHRAAARSTR